MFAVLPTTLAVPPVIFPAEFEIVGAGQVNVVPATTGDVFNARFALLPLQMV